MSDRLHITDLHALQVLDSRGRPTVHVRLRLADGTVTEATAPSGASTGRHEARELRDGGPAYAGAGVTRAVANVTGPIADLLTGSRWADLDHLDHALRDLDGSPDEPALGADGLGANALVAVSMAAARAFSAAAGLPLWAWVAEQLETSARLPVPHFNVLNGGAHAANGLAFQEFMVAPVGAPDVAEAVRCGAEVHAALAGHLRARGTSTGLGDEGGFAPELQGVEQALDLLVAAITDAGYTAGRPGHGDVAIALDPAANSFAGSGDRLGTYTVAGTTRTREEMVDWYHDLIQAYPVWSLEDGFGEDDHAGWAAAVASLGGLVQIVGDDLLVTNSARITTAARDREVTAALIKPNQIGTVTETFTALQAATAHGLAAMVSHRSGDTPDAFVADLAVGAGVGQLKAGAPVRGERVAKYNRLLAIADDAPSLPYGLAPVPAPQAQR